MYENFSAFGDFFRSLLPDAVYIASDRANVLDKSKPLRFIFHGGGVRFRTNGSDHRGNRFRLLDGCVANGVFVWSVGTVIVRLNFCLPQAKLARGVGSARADPLRLCAMFPAGNLFALRFYRYTHAHALRAILSRVVFNIRRPYGNRYTTAAAFPKEILRVTRNALEFQFFAVCFSLHSLTSTLPFSTSSPIFSPSYRFNDQSKFRSSDAIPLK